MNRSFKPLDDAGLNLQAVFDVCQLPQEVTDNLNSLFSDVKNFTQLILIGHAGRNLWSKLKENANGTTRFIENIDAIDTYTVSTLNNFFENHQLCQHYKVIYPSDQLVGLQKLGELAGWHFSSPFRVGVNDHWGSWFAYRALILANSNFDLTRSEDFRSPCAICISFECLNRCPAYLVENDLENDIENARNNEPIIAINACLKYRTSEPSKCADRCLARMGCPVASEHQYEETQINYHYRRSLDTIIKYRLDNSTRQNND